MPRISLGTYDGKLRSSQFVNVRNLRGGIITAQTIVIGGGTNGVIRSQNYDGTDGWAIFGDGSAYFGGDVVFGADVYSSNWVSGGGALPANLSSRDSNATAGYYLDHSVGAAQFVKIYADTGELRDLSILGTLTLGSGGVIQTATDGQRIELSEAENDRIRLYTGDVFEEESGVIRPNVSGSGNSLTLSTVLFAPTNNNDLGTLGISMINASFDDATSPPQVVFSYGGGSVLNSEFKIQDGMHLITTGDVTLSAGDVNLSAGTLNITALGSATSPAIGIGSNFDDGMYSSGDSSLNFAIAGVARLQLLPAGLLIKPAFADNNIVLGLGVERAWNFRQRSTGAGTALDLESTSNKDFYVRSTTNGDIMQFVGGTATGSRVKIDRNVSNVGNVNTLRIARGNAGSLQPIGYYSSWVNDPITGKKRKKYVLPLHKKTKALNKYWQRDWFLDLEPIKYERAQGDDTEDARWDHPQIELGFSLENLIEHTNLLTSGGDAVGDSPDEYALLAVTIDYVQSLEKRIAALEAQLA